MTGQSPPYATSKTRQSFWIGKKPGKAPETIRSDSKTLKHGCTKQFAPTPGATVVVDPWQAAHLTQNLRNRRVRIQEFAFSAQSVGRLAITLHRLLRDHQVALPEDAELIDELANVKLVETAPSSYRIDHEASAHDDRVISLALAAHRLVTTSAKPKVDRKKLAAAMANASAELWKPGSGAFDY